MTIDEVRQMLIGRRIVDIHVRASKVWDIVIETITLDDGTEIDVAGEPAHIRQGQGKRKLTTNETRG